MPQRWHQELGWSDRAEAAVAMSKGARLLFCSAQISYLITSCSDKTVLLMGVKALRPQLVFMHLAASLVFFLVKVKTFRYVNV